MTDHVDELEHLVGDVETPRIEDILDAGSGATTLSRVAVKTVDAKGEAVTIRFRGERLTWTESVEVYRHQDGRLVVVDLEAQRSGWAVLKNADEVPAFLARQQDARYAVPLYDAQRKLGRSVFIDL